MASIDTGGSDGKEGGKVRAKKMAVHIDFTPMVDLGFLLITFFMLTTTMNKPQVMEINMPLKEDVPPEDRTKFKESQTMTIVLGENNKVYYYFGITNPVLDSTNFSNDGIRKVLLEENKKRNPLVDSIAIYKRMLDNRIIKREEYKKNSARIKAYKDALIVVIKAEDKSKYRNLVDILDEMAICNIGRYAIVDITEQDKQLIAGTLPTTN
ncbi:MAG: biopolymer transporter ExbD [Bacteroidia bacterium]|nr:biopolymer transporter ExbD [Bacteroidia bacterium]HQV00664.1 biopolymer transporter ExbD [Bacteroidia bacterium]